MPAITATNILTGSAITETTLDGSTDTLTYNPQNDPILILRNPTGGAISPVIDGQGSSSVDVAGVGNVDVSGGYAVGSIAAGDSVAIRLQSISAYLVGTIDVTSGGSLVAVLLEQ